MTNQFQMTKAQKEAFRYLDFRFDLAFGFWHLDFKNKFLSAPK